jgi:hypothetical protein
MVPDPRTQIPLTFSDSSGGDSSVGTGQSNTYLVEELTVFHGHMLTSKVPFDKTVKHIMKYGFVTLLILS